MRIFVAILLEIIFLYCLLRIVLKFVSEENLSVKRALNKQGFRSYRAFKRKTEKHERKMLRSIAEEDRRKRKQLQEEYEQE